MRRSAAVVLGEGSEGGLEFPGQVGGWRRCSGRAGSSSWWTPTGVRRSASGWCPGVRGAVCVGGGAEPGRGLGRGAARRFLNEYENEYGPAAQRARSDHVAESLNPIGPPRCHNRPKQGVNTCSNMSDDDRRYVPRSGRGCRAVPTTSSTTGARGGPSPPARPAVPGRPADLVPTGLRQPSTHGAHPSPQSTRNGSWPARKPRSDRVSRVRRQGLEPRTRGLRDQSSPMRGTTTRQFARATGPSEASRAGRRLQLDGQTEGQPSDHEAPLPGRTTAPSQLSP